MEQFLVELLRTAPGTGLILLMLWYGQRNITERIDKMSRRMDCFETSQHACQLEVSKTYATKDDMKATWGRLDEHETRISRMEGRQ